MRHKKSRKIFLLIILLFLASLLLFSRIKQTPAIIKYGYYESVKLHTDDGHYITWAIKKWDSYDFSWEYVTPEWFSNHFGVRFFWCKDSYDFIIYSGDTGNHLYKYLPTKKTWEGAYYLKTVYEGGQDILYIWDHGTPIEAYSITKIPDELRTKILEY